MEEDSLEVLAMEDDEASLALSFKNDAVQEDKD